MKLIFFLFLELWCANLPSFLTYKAKPIVYPLGIVRTC